MGIYEQVISGTNFKRTQVTLSNSPRSGSSLGFEKSYILLGASSEAPCRVRLYSETSSVALDDSRPTSSFDINPAVGLVADMELDSSTLKLTFDPPIIGTTFADNKTWYHISSSTAQSVTFTLYPIEFSTSTGRSVITVSGTNIPSGTTGVEGNITSPKAFLILSASSDYAESRLRLYSKDITNVPNNEKIRSYGVEPTTGSGLITDMIFDSASFSNKLIPILEAYNLSSYEDGSNFVGYILQNVSSNPTANITASIYIYSVED